MPASKDRRCGGTGRSPVAYGDLFIMTIPDQGLVRVTRLKYGPPPAPEAGGVAAVAGRRNNEQKEVYLFNPPLRPIREAG